MPATADIKSVTAQTIKQTRWSAQRCVSKLQVLPVRIGLLGWAVNMVLRRPADFPTFAFARFRREIARQSRRAPLDAADIAVVKLRTRLLSSAIDPRSSRSFTGADIDSVVRATVAASEEKHGVRFGSAELTQFEDAAWQQYADLFGSPVLGRAAQLEGADGFVPSGGAALARRLRELEAEAVTTVREHPRQR